MDQACRALAVLDARRGESRRVRLESPEMAGYGSLRALLQFALNRTAVSRDKRDGAMNSLRM
jgi:hypothetical protein